MAKKTKRVELRLNPTQYNLLIELQKKLNKSRTEIIEIALMTLAKQTKCYITMSFMEPFDSTLRKIAKEKENETLISNVKEEEDNESIEDILKEIDDIVL